MKNIEKNGGRVLGMWHQTHWFPNSNIRRVSIWGLPIMDCAGVGVNVVVERKWVLFCTSFKFKLRKSRSIDAKQRIVKGIFALIVD
jgi:hypothetical protein